MNQFLDIIKLRSMRKLIINADDLGISEYVNSQIEKCINLGVITSSTLMANAPAFEDGVRIAKQYPNISIGVHLNIVEFAPLTNLELFKKHGVVGKDGNFVEGAFNVLPIDDELKRAVYEEWDAQIEKIEAAGIIPTHCDSHQHSHTIPDLQESLCRVLDKHSIKHVRRKMVPTIRLILRAKKNPTVVFDKSKAMKAPKRGVIYRRLYIFIAKIISYKWNLQMSKRYGMTDYFYNFRNYINDRDYINLGGKDSIIELMCHPGHSAYQKETETLLNGDSWSCHDSVFVSYRYLNNKRTF